MHKRRKSGIGRLNKWQNANAELPLSVRNSIFELTSSIDGGENPAATYLRESYRSKYCNETLTPATERRSNAIAKFRESEERNRSTNKWWMDAEGEFNILPRVSLKGFLRVARRYIRDVLGPLHDGVVVGSFSGGASTSRRRDHSHPAMKFVGKADITEPAEKFLPVLYREAPLLGQHVNAFDDLKIVKGNVLFTVPKKTDIDRCACKEPDVNMFLQKGVGKHIRQRLLRHGINLNDQSINRKLAREGSISGSLMTVDLSSASDSITVEVVRALLPSLWFEYLNDIRSPETEIDGETTVLEMFSSMGNGFTFELESLLFYALTRTVSYFEGVSGPISVYGDDIICSSELYDSLHFVFDRFGFVVNEEKSFHTGFFRESCGGHYLHGEDISPFYLKREATHLTDLIRVSNQFRRWAVPRQYDIPGLYQVWCSLAAFVPKSLWGGFDLEIDTRLASAPVGVRYKTLRRVSEPQRLSQLGLYLLWQNSNWNRSADPEGSADPVSTNQICRYRRVPLGVPVCAQQFREEF